jgi:hypothetical protein
MPPNGRSNAGALDAVDPHHAGVQLVGDFLRGVQLP